ncbi:MAG: trypsin-like peptidase domain-containing protein [Clostridia bacterium]|nr:trypsin-like peptidase domain-containing protein [Clostridia bacterium]
MDNNENIFTGGAEENSVEILSDMPGGDIPVARETNNNRDYRDDFSNNYKPLPEDMEGAVSFDADAENGGAVLLACGSAYRKKMDRRKKIILISSLCAAFLIVGGLCGFLTARAVIRKNNKQENSTYPYMNLYTTLPGDAAQTIPQIPDEDVTAEVFTLPTLALPTLPAATTTTPSVVTTPGQPQVTLPLPSAVASANTAVAKTAKEIYNDEAPGVVGITAKVNVENSLLGQSYVSESKGSGFIASNLGYIITNYHVVEGGKSFTVSFYDGSKKSAELLGYDDTNDIAVLKTDTVGRKVLQTGSSAALSVGDRVLVIGNPLGTLSYTLTDGVVSALDRLIADDSAALNMFQTNAAVNTGNSGGPVFNMNGEVIGIVTSKYTDASAEGLSFCIPIDSAIRSILDIVQYGYARNKPLLSVSVQTLSAATATRYSLPQGVYVVDIDTAGAAAQAGMQKYDVITAVNNSSITTVAELRTALMNYTAGSSIPITVYRKGSAVNVTVTAGERTPQPSRTGYSNVYDL